MTESAPIRRIHLMRHGEVHNPSGVLYERLPDFHLSDLGREMVAATALYLKASGPPIALCKASPLERAQESAAPAAKLFDLPIVKDERLIEAGNSFAGVSINARRFALAHPRYWWRYRNPARPSWGESYADIAARMRQAVRSALGDLAEIKGAEAALLVSHQLPIWTARRWLEGKSLAHHPGRRECALASLTTLVFAGKTLVDIEYCEPAADLLAEAADLVPGSSAARLRR